MMKRNDYNVVAHALRSVREQYNAIEEKDLHNESMHNECKQLCVNAIDDTIIELARVMHNYYENFNVYKFLRECSLESSHAANVIETF